MCLDGDKIIAPFKATQMLTQGDVGDSLNSEEICPPAVINGWCDTSVPRSCLATNSVELAHQPQHLIRDLELPLFEVPRCEGVRQDAALASVFALVHHVK